MSGSMERSPERSKRMSAARLFVHALTFAAIWAVLADGQGWGVGIPFILLAAVVSCLVAPMSRWSLGGLARFLPYFIWNSLRGGVDVAMRVLHPQLPIEPALVRYELRLDDAAARVMMADTVTLLPGTLSADLDDHVLVVHVLNADAPFTDVLEVLEQRVADLFGLDNAVKTP